MFKDLTYTFEDEIATKFCYDIDKKHIEIFFEGYTLNKKYYNNPCVFSISNWTVAKSKVNDEVLFSDLNKHIGIFSMILLTEFRGNSLKLIVNTIDDRYITLLFENPSISLMEISK